MTVHELNEKFKERCPCEHTFEVHSLLSGDCQILECRGCYGFPFAIMPLMKENVLLKERIAMLEGQLAADQLHSFLREKENEL